MSGVKDWISETKEQPSWERSEAVTRIVLGDLNATDNDRPVIELPDNLAELYPNLKCLHLWHLRDLKSIPNLPETLWELDVRGCEELERLPELPESLEVLVVGGAPNLKTIEVGSCGAQLFDLAITDCPKLEEAVLQDLLSAAPGLKELDYSGCSQLGEIHQWPETLERIELNRCTDLRKVPVEWEEEDDEPGLSWPPKLRRLGLRGASKLEMLPSLPKSCDYIDFAYAEKLVALPAKWPMPRTLYLYGSGVQVPPASEHGSKDDENVGRQTAEFFEDVRLTGQGSVNRCRVLVLGNGGAGKTCLSLNLTGKDVKAAEELGSTHGVQFWPWQLKGAGGAPTDIQVWDFGGQEIYHSTHRLFVGRGALFLVVWNPDDDPNAPREKTAGGYEDEWRPLSYWFDYIENACQPAQPRVALICSRKCKKTEQLEAQWRKELPEKYHSRVERCYYIDSLEGKGESDDLKNWVAREATSLIEAEGAAVPRYWDIAQAMVQEWLEPGRDVKTQMSRADFSLALEEKLKEVVAAEPRKYEKLREVLKSKGDAFLDDRRIERTLGFLTRIGWVFWREDLFEERVIVGQKWALDGIYALLDRRDKVELTSGQKVPNLLWQRLQKKQGQFTREELGELAKLDEGKRKNADWNDYAPEEQKLLLSFMEEVGLCFQLIPLDWKHWRYQEDPLYVSLEHLPEDDRELANLIASGELASPESETLSSPWLHKGDWQVLLKALGDIFRRDGRYAENAVWGENTEDQRIGVMYVPDRDEFGRPKGFGGSIKIWVNGPQAKERIGEMVRYVVEQVPSLKQTESDQQREPAKQTTSEGAGVGKQKTTVFVSYAWNVRSELRSEPKDYTDYEKPVDMLEKGLEQYEDVELVRDRNEMSKGDRVTVFMNHGLNCDQFVVVHSDKYWRGPYCVYEYEGLINKYGLEMKRLTEISHSCSGVYGDKGNKRQEYLDDWNSRPDSDGPPRLEKVGYHMSKLKAAASHIFSIIAPEKHDEVGSYVRWPEDSDKQEKLIEDLSRKLAGLPLLPTTKS